MSAPKPIDRICAHCGKHFFTYDANRQYCSHACMVQQKRSELRREARPVAEERA